MFSPERDEEAWKNSRASRPPFTFCFPFSLSLLLIAAAGLFSLSRLRRELVTKRTRRLFSYWMRKRDGATGEGPIRKAPARRARSRESRINNACPADKPFLCAAGEREAPQLPFLQLPNRSLAGQRRVIHPTRHFATCVHISQPFISFCYSFNF